MRHLTLVLLASLRLCRARAPGFSIHDDMLAFPQFEVVFSDGFIAEKDAEALLKRDTQHPIYSADFSQPTAGDARETTAAGADGVADNVSRALTYEVLNMSPHRYLCLIPAIQPPSPENRTANELAKAEEARELSRAAAKGWELLNQLQDSCLYFMSGWWSYSFCNNREIVQFHALAAAPNGQPPRRDPHTAEYVLGRIPTIPATADHKSQKDSAQAPPLPAELQVKGDQRYLVQRLESGTICDLTGRERTIEVQYHCVPGMRSDRIGWIKEVTICAYVMIVNTPRLCNDVAFLPPEEIKANPISCQLIADDSDADRPLLGQGVSAADDATGATEQEKSGESEVMEAKEKAKEPTKKPEVTVGGVVIGAQRMLSGADESGKPVKLEPPQRPFYSEGRLIEVLIQAASKEDGGKIKMPSAEELEKLDIKPEVVEKMKEKMEQLAGDAGWKLEIVEMDGGNMRELRGYIDGGESGESGSEAKDEAKDKDGGKDRDNDGSNEEFFKEL